MKFNFIILLINFTYVLVEKCPEEDIFFPCKCSPSRYLTFDDMKTAIECNSPNLTRIFNFASEKLENANQSKHFTSVKVVGRDGQLVLNESSFADITFDQFIGYNFELINQKAFGKSSQTIRDFQMFGDHVKHSPPEYHVWNMLNSLANVMQITIPLDITEIPSYAFGRQSNLRTLKIHSSNYVIIRSKAFYHLNNLTHLTIGMYWDRYTSRYGRYGLLSTRFEIIQNGAFAFEKPSNQKLNIVFERFQFDGEFFEPGSFDGIQRPVQLILLDSYITYLPETMLKSFLNNSNNTITFDNSPVNCFDCRNLWLLRENPHQLKNVECREKPQVLAKYNSRGYNPRGNNPMGNNPMGNNPVGYNPVGYNPVGYNTVKKNQMTLLSFETELYFKSNCNLEFTPNNKSEINYYPCEYSSEKNILRCPSNITNIGETIFKSISSQLSEIDKHFRWLIIYKAQGLTNNYLILDKYSFWDIKFDNFAGENVIIKHINAFGKAAQSIKKLIIWNGFSDDLWNNNHCVYNYDDHCKSKSFLNQFINVEYININLNISEISSNVLNSANLNTLILTTQKKLTIKNNAFYGLENLNELQFNCDLEEIESGAFAIKKRTYKRLMIKFYNINTNVFKTELWKGLQRPVHIILDSFVNYIDLIPETTFKTILDNQNNITINSDVNCTDCNNFWLIRDGRDKQVFGAKCNHNNDLTLFHTQIKCLLSTKCLSHEYATLFNNQNKIHCNQIKSIDYNDSVELILISIFVPLIVVVLLAGGIFYYRKYRSIHMNYMRNFIFRRGDDTTAMI